MAQLRLGFLAAPAFLGGPEGDVVALPPLWVRSLVLWLDGASASPPFTLAGMKRLLNLGLIAAVVAMLVPVSASSKYEGHHKVYAHFGEKWQVKPRTLYIGNYTIEELEWAHWNSRATVGEGIFPYNNCQPSCAAGHISRYETWVVLRRAIRCPGRRSYIYTKLTYLLPRSAPSGGATFTMSCSGRFKSFHQL